MRDVPIIPMGEDPGGPDASGDPPTRLWQSARGLSSIAGAGAQWLDPAERFLAEAGFDRAPWLAVVFASGIIAWFALPQSAVGPSFQMSFAAVLAIIALANSASAAAFLAPRDEPWWARTGRRITMLFATGVVIELALMPIVLFHFHRAGMYGALANVVAIPLVTFVAMPLIALGLLLDTMGLGGPVWWLVAGALELLLGIAHLTAGQAGAVRLMP